MSDSYTSFRVVYESEGEEEANKLLYEYESVGLTKVAFHKLEFVLVISCLQIQALLVCNR